MYSSQSRPRFHSHSYLLTVGQHSSNDSGLWRYSVSGHYKRSWKTRAFPEKRTPFVNCSPLGTPRDVPNNLAVRRSIEPRQAGENPGPG